MLNINEYLINRQTKEKNGIKPGMSVLILELYDGDVKNAFIKIREIASVVHNRFEINYNNSLSIFELNKKNQSGLIFPNKDWYISAKTFHADDVYIIHPVKALELIENYMDDPTGYFVENVELDSVVDLKHLQKLYNELKKSI